MERPTAREEKQVDGPAGDKRANQHLWVFSTKNIRCNPLTSIGVSATQLIKARRSYYCNSQEGETRRANLYTFTTFGDIELAVRLR